MRTPQPLFALALLAIAILPAAAATAGDSPTATAKTGGIQWFATWEQASKEAKRTQRPILLIAAAPHCKHISGVW